MDRFLRGLRSRPRHPRPQPRPCVPCVPLPRAAPPAPPPRSPSTWRAASSLGRVPASGTVAPYEKRVHNTCTRPAFDPPSILRRPCPISIHSAICRHHHSRVPDHTRVAYDPCAWYNTPHVPPPRTRGTPQATAAVKASRAPEARRAPGPPSDSALAEASTRLCSTRPVRRFDARPVTEPLASPDARAHEDRRESLPGACVRLSPTLSHPATPCRACCARAARPAAARASPLPTRQSKAVADLRRFGGRLLRGVLRAVGGIAILYAVPFLRLGKVSYQGGR